MENRQDEALRRFLQRVWREDVRPLLAGSHPEHRRTGARLGGSFGAAGGILLDKLFRLRGRPFMRAFTVMGSSLGALLPDVWDWRWFRGGADAAARETIAREAQRRAAAMEEAEALELLGLEPTAARDDLKRAWRLASQRWHPDKSPDEASRAEYQLRFVTLHAAYDRLIRSYDTGRLPRA